MQLHHFAYHQQGGHRGVFRQVFELLQCAGYRLLIVTGAAGNYRHRRGAVATRGDKLGAELRSPQGGPVYTSVCWLFASSDQSKGALSGL